MKEIKAYIKRHRLADVTRALHKVEGLSGMSVSDARGFGRGRAKDSPDRITEELVDFIPCVKLEIICHDELTERVISTIQQAAHTGLRGDGKIYQLPVEEAVRISSGDRGTGAC